MLTNCMPGGLGAQRCMPTPVGMATACRNTDTAVLQPTSWMCGFTSSDPQTDRVMIMTERGNRATDIHMKSYNTHYRC